MAIKLIRTDSSGRKYWQVDWRPQGAKGPHRYRTLVGTRLDAQRFLDDQQAYRTNIKAGLAAPARRLADAVKDYLSSAEADKEEGHLKNVRRTLRALVAEFPAAATAEAVTAGWLREWRTRRAGQSARKVFRAAAGGQPRELELGRKVSARTVNRELAEIRAFLAHELEEDRLRENPAERVKKLEEEAPRERWLWPAEYAAIWERACPEIRDALDVYVTTGLRWRELVELRSEDLRELDLVVLGKAGNWLTLPVGPELRRILRRRVAAGKRWRYLASISHRLYALCDAAEVERVSVKALRTTCCCWLLGADMNPYWVSARLGHASVQTTQEHYALVPSDFRQRWPQEVRKLLHEVTDIRQTLPVRKRSKKGAGRSHPAPPQRENGGARSSMVRAADS